VPEEVEAVGVILWLLALPLLGAALFVVATSLLATFVFPGGGQREAPEPWALRSLGRVAWLGLEWWSSLRVLVAMPFRRMGSRGYGGELAKDSAPVALLPGYLENAFTLAALERRLARALGVPVRAFSPPRYLASLDRLAEDYQRQIEGWLKSLGARKVVLVGHSMGGLLARQLVECPPQAGRQAGAPSGRLRVAAVITLATPHQGSALSPFALGRNARQMRRGSGFLEVLNTSQPPSAVRYAGVCSIHDNLVVPWTCGLSPRGENHVLRYRGHLSLLFSRQVVRCIVDQLKA
jgi:triacylglycerol lipase